MGGCSIEDEWELTAPSSGTRTLVLVGRTGNGKSATGNTILGEEVFHSQLSSSGVTSSCELQITVSKDGHMVHVIDTPGLFDVSLGHDRAVKTHFTEEEAATICNLQYLFGSKIFDYMIVLFTGGDELKGRTLDDFLGRNRPQPLKGILSLCNNRVVLFDNNAKDEVKRAGQVKELMTLVNNVAVENGGRPCRDDVFLEMQKRGMVLLDKQHQVDSLSSRKGAATNQELVKIEEKLRVTAGRVEEEPAARLKAEEDLKNQIHMLQETLERSARKVEEIHRKLQAADQRHSEKQSWCAIL